MTSKRDGNITCSGCPWSHDATASFRKPSPFCRGFRRSFRYVFHYFSHQLSCKSRAFRIAIAAHFLGIPQTLKNSLATIVKNGETVIANGPLAGLSSPVLRLLNHASNPITLQECHRLLAYKASQQAFAILLGHWPSSYDCSRRSR